MYRCSVYRMNTNVINDINIDIIIMKYITVNIIRSINMRIPNRHNIPALYNGVDNSTDLMTGIIPS